MFLPEPRGTILLVSWRKPNGRTENSTRRSRILKTTTYSEKPEHPATHTHTPKREPWDCDRERWVPGPGCRLPGSCSGAGAGAPGGSPWSRRSPPRWSPQGFVSRKERSPVLPAGLRAAASAASLVLKRRPATLRLPVNGGVPDAGAAGWWWGQQTVRIIVFGQFDLKFKFYRMARTTHHILLVLF